MLFRNFFRDSIFCFMLKNIRQLICKYPDRFAAGVIAVAVLAFFLPSLTFEKFAFDDTNYVGQAHLFELTFSNIHYHLTHKTVELYSPLVMLSYMPDYLLWGKEYFISGCRLQNILWHLAAALLLYRIFREFKITFADGTHLEIPVPAALFTVLCWALHPQRMESVIWIAERKDGMITGMAFIMICLIIRAHKREQTSIAAPLLLMISLFTVKPMLLTFPLIILTGFLTVTNGNIKLSMKHSWPLFLPVLLYVIVNRSIFSGIASSVEVAQKAGESRLPIAVWNIFRYAFKTIFPVKLSPLYPYYGQGEISWLPVLIFVAVAGTVIYFACRKAPEQPFFAKILLPGGLMFGLAIAPVCSFHRIGNVDFADRYSYFPSIFIWCGIALLLVFIWNKLKETYAHAVILAVAAYFAVLAVLSVSYMSAWRNFDTQVDAMLDCEKPHFQALFLAASDAFEHKKYRDAMRYTLLLDNNNELNVFFRNCMTGMVLAKTGRTEEGFKYISELFAKEHWAFWKQCPNNMKINCFNFMVNYHYAKKDIALYHRNLLFLCSVASKMLRDVYGQESLNFAGIALLLNNDFAAAEQHFAKASALFPKDEILRSNLEAARKKDASKIAIETY